MVTATALSHESRVFTWATGERCGWAEKVHPWLELANIISPRFRGF